MSSECPPASAGVANLYALAADKAEIFSPTGKICEATLVSNVNPLANTAVIEGQCNATVSDSWTTAFITDPNGKLVMAVSINPPISVNAGDLIVLAITLRWG